MLMKVIGVETSCDETAVAVIEISDKRQEIKSIKVLSNTISSQVKLHAKYGGVVPNLAAREHVKNIGHVFRLALKTAKINPSSDGFKKEIDLIAVTRGPGLGPALLVGITFAKTIAWKYSKPLIGVSHLEGHIYSNWLPITVNPKLKILNSKQIQNSKFKIDSKNIFPVLNLIVSGGHTELVLMLGHGKYKLIGETLDDAIGEAFDKVARLLSLGYPGGPAISKIAEKGNPNRYPLPSPMIHAKNYNFSYSGLKTAVLYLLRDLNFPIRNSKFVPIALQSRILDRIGIIRNSRQKADIAASFQKAALDVLILKTIKAAKEYKVKSILLSGGVSANKELRKRLSLEAKKIKIKYSQPELEYTGDNAAMIALAGYFSAQKHGNKKDSLNWESVEMDANLGF